MAELLVRPTLFATGLDNAIEFSSDKKGLEVNDSVWVSWTGETFRFMGRGRYSAVVYDLAPAKESEQEPWDVIVSLDTAREASAEVKKSPDAGKKATTVEIVPLSDGAVNLVSGPEVVSVLENAPGHEDLRPTEEYEGLYEKLERISEMPTEEVPPASPIVFTKGVIAKLSKLKTDVTRRDEDRWELHYIGGASWIYRYMGEQSAASVMLESCRDSLG